MNLYEFAEQIEAAVNGLSKTAQKVVRTNCDAAWRLTCLITSGWITPDDVTAKGRDHLDKLAREVGLIQHGRRAAPIVEDVDAGGVIHRRFVVLTTTERRRDRRVRAALRRWRIGIDPDLYARVWAATVGVTDAEAVALVYQAELARAALAQAYGHRPDVLTLAARQINKAAKSLALASTRPLIALPPVVGRPADEVTLTGDAHE